MSINNILKPNNYDIFCDKITTDTIETNNYIIDNIIVDNATINNTITTENIISNTTTFNTVGSINLGAVNGDIINLNSNNADIENLNVNDLAILNNVNITGTLTTSAFNPSSLSTENIYVDNISPFSGGNIGLNGPVIGSNITLSSSLTSPLTKTNQIDTTTGAGILVVVRPTVFNLNVTVGGSIAAGTATLTSLVGSIMNYGSGTITSLSGNNMNYGIGAIGSLSGNGMNYSTGNISTLSGSEFNYDIGYAEGLSCKELRIFTELVECPRATIDDLYVRNTLNVDNIQTNTTGTVNFNNQITGPEIVLNTRMNAPTTETDVIRTISGSGNVTFNSPLIFTAAPGYIQEPININAKQSQTTPVSGGATTTPTNVTLQYCRSGSQVLINVPDGTFTSSGVVGILILTPPAPWSFPSAFAAGTCILNYAGINYQINYRYVSASNQFQFTANNESNLLNSGVGCPVVPAATTFLIRGFTISLVV